MSFLGTLWGLVLVAQFGYPFLVSGLLPSVYSFSCCNLSCELKMADISGRNCERVCSVKFHKA